MKGVELERRVALVTKEQVSAGPTLFVVTSCAIRVELSRVRVFVTGVAFAWCFGQRCLGEGRPGRRELVAPHAGEFGVTSFEGKVAVAIMLEQELFARPAAGDVTVFAVIDEVKRMGVDMAIGAPAANAGQQEPRRPRARQGSVGAGIRLDNP